MRFSRLSIALACLALSAPLAGCLGDPPATASTSPPATAQVDKLPSVLAPLAGTHVDEEAMRVAWKSADAGLYVVDFLRSFGWIKDGSPKAIALADGLETLRRWLNAADDARQAGNQASANAAFAKASVAYLAFRRALEN